MARIGLGVIGCGVIAQWHLEGAKESPQVQLVAVADIREEAARAAAAKFGVPNVYTSAEALLADPRVDAVVLALPAAPRTAIALRALACGKHVLLEKPVAMNAGEVERLIAARGPLVVGCCEARFRLLPHARAITEFLATGALGPIRVLHCRAILGAAAPPTKPPPPWRLNRAQNGGGILMNWGCYDLDYLLGLTGWTIKPRRVLARTWAVPAQYQAYAAPGSDAETQVAALIQCDDGVVITYERGEFVAAQSEEAWRIIGTRGTLRLQMTPGQPQSVDLDEADRERGVTSRMLWEGNEDFGMMNRGIVQDFAAAIAEGRPPLATLDQALVVQKISDAVYASAETGQAVEIC